MKSSPSWNSPSPTTTFMFNDSVYKQIHGCAMGSPVSPVVANLCMEIQFLKNRYIAASTTPPKVWKRYVDDSFVIIKKHFVSKFHDTLNAVDPKISFTLETENNGQISFLDTLKTRKNGTITIGVYRKSTHTDDRYLDFNSHHELKHKLSTASSLLISGTQPPEYLRRSKERADPRLQCVEIKWLSISNYIEQS